jgi:hypothetical protein
MAVNVPSFGPQTEPFLASAASLLSPASIFFAGLQCGVTPELEAIATLLYRRKTRLRITKDEAFRELWPKGEARMNVAAPAI